MSEYVSNLRKKIGKQLLLLPSIACIITKGDSVLLQERADTKNWGLPGGILDPGETLIEGLKREILEETGLSIESPVLLGIYSGTHEAVQYPNGDQCCFVRSVFVSESFTGTLMHDQESLSLKFFPIDNLPDPLHPIHIKVLTDFLDYRNGQKNIPIVF